MAAPQTNFAKYNVLIYGVNPDQPTWPVHRFSLQNRGSYAVQGADNSDHNGTYRGYVTECMYNNQWGNTLGPSLVAGELAYKITRNSFETPLAFEDFAQAVNFLTDYDFYFFAVDDTDPLPTTSNLFYQGKVLPGGFTLHKGSRGDIDAITIRILDRIKFDDQPLLRQPYLTQTEADEWTGGMKPLIFGNWWTYEQGGVIPDADDLYWVEAPVIDTDKKQTSGAGCGGDDYFTADTGAHSDDIEDSRRAASFASDWGDDSCTNPDDAGEFLQLYENGWQRRTTTGGTPIDPVDDILCNQIAGPVKNCRLSSYDAGWTHLTADKTGTCGKYSSVAIDDDGAFHIASWNETTNQIQYATNRTTDQTWKTYTPDDGFTRGEYCSLAVDSNAAVHISYAGINEDGNYALFYTTNESGAWVTTTVESDSSWEYKWTSICISDGDVHISYYQEAFTGGYLYYATNSTGAFVTESVDDVGDNQGEYSSIAVESGGAVHISYYDSTVGNVDLKYATGTAGSWTLSVVDSVGGVGRYTSIAIETDGSVHISYWDGTNNSLKYASNRNGTWTPVAVDTGGIVGDTTGIAIDSSGYNHIAYYDLTNTALKYATDKSGVWLSETVDNTANDGQYVAIALDGSDNVHISYYDATTFDLLYVTGVYGSWGAPVVVDSGGVVGKWTSISTDSNDKPHISYNDESNTSLKYATNASGSWVAETVDNNGSVGTHTGLSVDTSDVVHISYYDTSNSALKYAVGIAGSWTLATIDNSASVGTWNWIDTDDDDNAYICYYDASNTTLKYATNVSGSWITIVVDSSVSITNNSRIAVDSDGNSHISYYDTANTALKYANNTRVGGLWQDWTVDDTASVGRYNSIAVDSDGKAHIAYFNGTGNDLYYIDNANDLFECETIDSGGIVGKWTSIALDSDDYVYISYFDETNNSLKMATDVTKTWVTSTVDSDKECGQYTSIAIDSDDDPHISYFVERSTEGAWQYLQIVNSAGTDWQSGQAAMLRAPRGFPQYDEGEDGDTATHPVDIIYLLLRDKQIGLSLTDAAIDTDSFTDVKAALGGITARTFHTSDITVMRAIGEICEEYQLALVVESGKYKIIALNWTSDPAPSDTITHGQILGWNYSSDRNQQTMTNFTVKYKLNPSTGKYNLTYQSDPAWDSGSEPKTLKSRWIYEQATMRPTGARMLALYGRVIRTLEMECDLSCMGYALGDRVIVSTDPDDANANVSGTYQVAGYDKDYVRGQISLTLTSSSMPET